MPTSSAPRLFAYACARSFKCPNAETFKSLADALPPALYACSKYGVTIEIRPRQSIGSSSTGAAFVASEYFCFAAAAIFGAWSAKN
jgi:hypothetical protein